MKEFTIGLTALFIALKLAGLIGWSWWWVMAPIRKGGDPAEWPADLRVREWPA